MIRGQQSPPLSIKTSVWRSSAEGFFWIQTAVLRRKAMRIYPTSDKIEATLKQCLNKFMVSAAPTWSRRAASSRKVACVWSRRSWRRSAVRGRVADGAGQLGPEGPHQGGRPGARDAEERFEVAAGEQGPVEHVELRDGVGEGEEPPGAGGHRREPQRSVQPVEGVMVWDHVASGALRPCEETVVSNASVAAARDERNIKDVMLLYAEQRQTSCTRSRTYGRGAAPGAGGGARRQFRRMIRARTSGLQIF